MIRIAIIGDIGSGKSYISKLFGFPVFNADLEVKKIYKNNKRCFLKLNRKLPKYILTFPIKKEELLKAIIKNKQNIFKINNIVHPEVRLKLKKFLKKNKSKLAVILDIPLLLENKINHKKDILIFVDSKKKQVNKRLKKRPNFNMRILKQLKSLQLPLEIKRKKANFIIKNNFKRFSIMKDVKLLKKIILK
tara:strand:- start:1329 stop:1901 length:573 start_codon:yes stop_codon:yes gene_type:complete